MASLKKIKGAQSFGAKYPTTLNNVKARMFEYVQYVEDLRDTCTVGPGELARPVEKLPTLAIQCEGPGNIPLLPPPGVGPDPDVLLKNELVPPVRRFMSLHWGMLFLQADQPLC